MDREIMYVALIIICVLLIFAVLRKLIYRRGGYIDNMSGEEFEEFLAEKFSELGYEVYLTGASRDFGADIIATKDDEKLIIQAKRYSEKVSVPAVQQAFTAMYYYDGNRCMVVTNNYFTEPSVQLADKVGVELVDRDGMNELFGLKLKTL